MRCDLIIEGLHQSANTYDPFKICESLDVLLEYVDIENPLGDTIYLHQKPIIMLAKKIKHSPQSYFVCAHELGHIVNQLIIKVCKDIIH
ncbi:MAG TPA: ImmA/IrrE family metallo-endopeptidase [Candidatus Ligilactobacillus excrementavium]|nr:ImmA/IrrE family metallo-endopeptidase [Candidatus Ligilactobacillus excrementavium]